MFSHIDTERLSATVDPEVGSRLARDDQEHLQTCARCRARVGDLQRLRARLVASGGTIPTFQHLEDRIMARVSVSPPPRSTSLPIVGDRILPRWTTSRRTVLRLVTVAALVLVVVLVGGVSQISSQAWTLEQSIAATRPMRGLHLSGTLDGRVGVEIWVRGELDRSNAVDDLLLRTDDGSTVSVQGNRTTYHGAGQQTAYTDDAQTAGIWPVPGAAFLEFVRRVSTAHATESRLDVFHLRKVTTLRAQLVDASGPKSLELEFDASTGLLTRMVVWRNVQRAGVPAFAADVQYYPDLPDERFASALPEAVTFRERPVTLPAETIALLATGDGLPFADGGAEATSRAVVDAVYRALISRDHLRLRELAPVTRLWTDTQVDAVFGGPVGLDRVTEVVSLGEPRARGASPLGPLMIVPAAVRHADGRLYDEQLIVQVRPGADGGTCVVAAPYGQPYPRGGKAGQPGR
jgi:hypothetical protein